VLRKIDLASAVTVQNVFNSGAAGAPMQAAIASNFTVI
jgi:hypothetical protein